MSTKPMPRKGVFRKNSRSVTPLFSSHFPPELCCLLCSNTISEILLAHSTSPPISVWRKPNVLQMPQMATPTFLFVLFCWLGSLTSSRENTGGKQPPLLPVGGCQSQRMIRWWRRWGCAFSCRGRHLWLVTREARCPAWQMGALGWLGPWRRSAEISHSFITGCYVSYSFAWHSEENRAMEIVELIKLDAANVYLRQLNSWKCHLCCTWQTGQMLGSTLFLEKAARYSLDTQQANVEESIKLLLPWRCARAMVHLGTWAECHSNLFIANPSALSSQPACSSVRTTTVRHSPAPPNIPSQSEACCILWGKGICKYT